MTRTWEHPRKGYQCCHDWLERMQIGLVGVPGDPGTVGRRPSSYSSGYPPRKPPLARSLEWAIIENYGKARRSNKKARQVQQCLGGLMRYFHPDSESELRWILLISLDIFGSYICIWKLLPNCIFFRTGKTNRTVKLHTFGCLVQKFGNYSLFFFGGGLVLHHDPLDPSHPVFQLGWDQRLLEVNTWIWCFHGTHWCGSDGSHQVTETGKKTRGFDV